MSENVIPLQDYRPHLHLDGPVICLNCKHEWHGVSPVGRYAGLECPQCSLENGVRKGLGWPENTNIPLRLREQHILYLR